MATPEHARAVNPKPMLLAGTLLGIGLGGFVDGIVFHQILQIHNMLSAQRPPDTLVNKEINMVWDGLFHAVTWTITVIGLILLFRAGARADRFWSGQALAGAMLLGWGLFNLVEGIVNHHILHVHHVVEEMGPSVWDWVFLGSGVAMIVAGALLIGSAWKRWPASGRAPAVAGPPS